MRAVRLWYTSQPQSAHGDGSGRSTVKPLCTIFVLAILLAVAAPATAADYRSGAGFAFTSGIVDADFLLPEELAFVGYTIFWKVGITERWGVLVSYRDMEDDEFLLFAEEDEYTQIAVHAMAMWRHGKQVRPHVKFGLARTELEATIPFTLNTKDDDTTLSIGGGLEAGSERIAFFADYDFTEPELNLVGIPDDYSIWNLSLGMIFKY